MDSRGKPASLLFLLCLLILVSVPCYSLSYSIEQGKQLRHGETLQSSSGVFKLGFFLSFDYMKNESYFGLWYQIDQGYEGEGNDLRISGSLWTANRDAPIFNRSGVLSLDGNGNLKIFSGETEVITLYSTQASINARAILQDDGNFVLHELDSNGSMKRILWQSFDHPTDNLLPGMKLGIRTTLTSARSNSFASGSFTLGLDPNGTKQLVIWRQKDVYWRSGSWRESSSDFLYFPAQGLGYNFSFTQTENETYFSCTNNNLVRVSRIMLHTFGVLWISITQKDGKFFYISIRIDGYNSMLIYKFNVLP